MKRLYNFIGLFLILLASTNLFGEEKSKVIDRSFSVSPSTLIEIDNKFGKIHINTWDKNEAKVHVEIVAEGNNPDRILEKIDVQFDESGGYLKMATILKEVSERKSSFSINYTVELPKSNRLKLKNKFGDTYLADLNADVEMDIQYGNLKTERLNGNVQLDLSFGSAMNHISYIKKGVVNVKYSKLTIDVAETLTIDSQFSDIISTKMGSTNLEMKYGKFNVETLGRISGSQSFSEFKVTTVMGDINLDLKHNDVKIERVKDNVKSIKLIGQFSKMEVGVSNNFSAGFTMNFQFADLKYDDEKITFQKRIRENTKNFYEGHIGKSGSSSKIYVESKYGDLKLNIGE